MTALEFLVVLLLNLLVFMVPVVLIVSLYKLWDAHRQLLALQARVAALEEAGRQVLFQQKDKHSP